MNPLENGRAEIPLQDEARNIVATLRGRILYGTEWHEYRIELVRNAMNRSWINIRGSFLSDNRTFEIGRSSSYDRPAYTNIIGLSYMVPGSLTREFVGIQFDTGAQIQQFLTFINQARAFAEVALETAEGNEEYSAPQLADAYRGYGSTELRPVSLQGVIIANQANRVRRVRTGYLFPTNHAILSDEWRRFFATETNPMDRLHFRDHDVIARINPPRFLFGDSFNAYQILRAAPQNFIGGEIEEIADNDGLPMHLFQDDRYNEY